MPFPDSEYPSIVRGKDKRESQRLLAAAPEMLAALRDMRVALPELGVDYYGHKIDKMINHIDLVLAKAEGRSE